MKNILVSIILLFTISSFAQGGLLKPRYIGWPIDSFQTATLKWDPATYKCKWVVDGAGGDSTTFVGDSVCIINMGVETCISLDSVYFTDSSFCYIQLPDTTCIDWNSANGNVYTISGTLTGHRVLQQGAYSFKISRSNDALYGNTTWSQPGLYPIISISGGVVPNEVSPILSLSSSGQEGDQYLQYNGPVNTDYSIGVSRSSTLNPFTIAEGEDLGGSVGRAMMQFHSVGDSIVITNNVLTSGPALRIRSNNTGAASSSQKGLDIDLKGANGTASQTSYGGYFSNTHTGTSPTNYGVYGVVNNGTNVSAGVRGIGTTNIGVYGSSTSANGVFGSSSSETGVKGSTATGTGVIATATTSTGLPLSVVDAGGATNTVEVMIDMVHDVTGTAANGSGTSITYTNETSSSAARLSNTLTSKWADATDATRSSQFVISGTGNATTNDIIYFEGDKRTRFNGRAELQQGADIASVAGAITLGGDGNMFEITGTNSITLISNVGWQNGSEITLLFTSTASLTDGTANSGTDIGMELAGNTNFTGSADDVVTLVLSEIGGTQRWREKCRSIN